MSLASVLIDSIMGDNSFEMWKAQKELEKKQLMAQYGILPEELNKDDPNSVTYADVYRAIAQKVSSSEKEKEDISHAKLALKGFEFNDPGNITRQAMEMYGATEKANEARNKEINRLRDLLKSAQDTYNKNRTQANRNAVGQVLSEITKSPVAEDVLGEQKKLYETMVSKSAEPSIENALATGNMFALYPKPTSGKGSAASAEKARIKKLQQFFDNLAVRNREVYSQFRGIDIDEARAKFELLKQQEGLEWLGDYSVDDLYKVPGVMLPKEGIQRRDVEKELSVPATVLDYQIQAGRGVSNNDIIALQNKFKLSNEAVTTLKKKYADEIKKSSVAQHAKIAHDRASDAMKAVQTQINLFYDSTYMKKTGTPEGDVNFFLFELPKSIDPNSNLVDIGYFKSDSDNILYDELNNYKKIFTEDNIKKFYEYRNGYIQNSMVSDLFNTYLLKLNKRGNAKTKQFASILQQALNGYTPPSQVLRMPFKGNPEELKQTIKELEKERQLPRSEVQRLYEAKNNTVFNKMILEGIQLLNTDVRKGSVFERPDQ